GGGLNAWPYNQVTRFPRVYVSKLDSRLEQKFFTACFFGGAGRAITLDSEGAIYIAGGTTKYLTTTTGALRTAPDPDERSKGFVTKVDGAGRRLIYSTYFGGDGVDDIQGLAVDSLGRAYICGSTTSTNLGAPGAARPNHSGATLYRSTDGGYH